MWGSKVGLVGTVAKWRLVHLQRSQLLRASPCVHMGKEVRLFEEFVSLRETRN